MTRPSPRHPLRRLRLRPEHRVTYARTLHPGAWWLWALGLAAAATRTLNPVPLLLALAVSGLVVAARRSPAAWGRSYAAFLKLALLIVVVRIVLQALLSTSAQGPTELFTLPSLDLPDGTGLKLGGVVTLEAVLAAFYEGLQLAVIICCVGAANALGSARRLLRSVPGALYEIGVACVIALTFAPQLVTDAQRIRAAHRLRGHRGGALSTLRRLAMPVLEGALDRSVDLAAAMDSRGYGRTVHTGDDRDGANGADGAPARRLTGLLVLGGLLGVCVGVYGLLDASTSELLGLPMLAVGVALAAGGLALGGRRVGRTRYRPDPWALPEWLVVTSGLAAAVAAWVERGLSPELLVLASPTTVPPVPWLTCLGVLVAVLPAILAPPLPGIAAATGDDVRRDAAPREEVPA